MKEATIIIRTPQTSNGLLNLMDDEGKMVYRDTIVPAGQRKFYEKLNTQLPDNLKHKILDNNGEAEVKKTPASKKKSDENE